MPLDYSVFSIPLLCFSCDYSFSILKAANSRESNKTKAGYAGFDLIVVLQSQGRFGCYFIEYQNGERFPLPLIQKSQNITFPL